MKAIKSLLATSLIAAAAVPAVSIADPVLLTFEPAAGGSVPMEPVHLTPAYLNPSLGISFSNTAWLSAGQDYDELAFGNFRGNGADNLAAILLATDPNTVPPAVPVPGAPGQTLPATQSFFIDVSKGFNGTFSVDLAGIVNSVATVTAYDGNVVVATGQGTALSACDQNVFCNWSTISLDLKGATAYRIEVAGADSLQWFDNFNFSNVLQDNGATVPEPGGIALSMAALGGLFLSRRRVTAKR